MPIKDPDKRRENHNRYMRERYANDAAFREKHKGRVKARKIALKEKIQERILSFKASGCTYCQNENEPCALVGHHVDPSTKDFSLAQAMEKSVSVERLEKEIQKCICLCKNCHAKLHAGIIALPSFREEAL